MEARFVSQTLKIKPYKSITAFTIILYSLKIDRRKTQREVLQSMISDAGSLAHREGSDFTGFVPLVFILTDSEKKNADIVYMGLKVHGVSASIYASHWRLRDGRLSASYTKAGSSVSVLRNKDWEELMKKDFKKFASKLRACHSREATENFLQ